MLASFEHVQELDPKEVDFLNHSYRFKTVVIEKYDGRCIAGIVSAFGTKNLTLTFKKKINLRQIIPISKISKVKYI